MSEGTNDYTVRKLTAADAIGMPDLANRVYGADYFHREVFDPEELLAKNRARELTSVVAVDELGKVVAHAALERPQQERFSKLGEAMVLHEHRNRSLLAKMGVLLLEEAFKQGLTGLYAEPVTHHVFSQRTLDAGQGVPTGVKLGAWVTAGFGIDFPQRVTPIVYFKYFVPPPPKTLFIPQRHQPLAAKIFGRLGREVAFGNGQQAASQSEIQSRFDQTHRCGFITVGRTGADCAARVRQARATLLAQGSEVVFLDVVIDDPGAPAACDELEADGFFFSGVQPDLYRDRDLLRLQFEVTPIDFELIQSASAFARELLDYIANERNRTA